MFSEKIDSISRACLVTEKIFHKTLGCFDSFSSEKQAAGFVLHEMKKLGFRPSFPVIVGSGPGGSEPHHKPFLPLVNGFCVIDLGVRVNGFCADFTRTIFLGKPSKKDIFLYNLVFKAQVAGIKAIKAGNMATIPYLAACRVLGKYSENFVHGLGHGLGKKIHIKPFMKKESKDKLFENDVLTVEPGIYFKNKFGIRTEDVFIVTKNNCSTLTNPSKKLICFSLKR